MIPVLCLLALAVIIPSACVLWFMTQAMRNERLAVRQHLTEIFQSSLDQAAKQIDEYWYKKEITCRSLPQTFPLQKKFHELVNRPGCDTALIFNSDGELAYPIQAKIAPNDDEILTTQKANDLRAVARSIRDDLLAERNDRAIRTLTEHMNSKEFQTLQDATGRYVLPNLEMLMIERTGDSQRLNNIILQFTKTLSSYDLPMPSSQRVFLIQRLMEQSFETPLGPVSGSIYIFDIGTFLAEKLALELADTSIVDRPTRQLFPITGDYYGWLDPSRTYLLVYRIGGFQVDIKHLLDQSFTLPDSHIVLLPPSRSSSQPAQPLFIQRTLETMPGWTLGVSFNGVDPFASVGDRQKTIHLWTGLLGVAAMAILIGLIGRYQMRQMKLTRLKNDFVATVTHELKTPLASMRLLTDTLLEKRYKDETQMREYLELIGRENHRLSRLIDNFLTFSRMERNKRVFDFREVQPGEIVDVALESIREKLVAEGFELKVNVEPSLPAIIADRDGLATVLINLLDNACKYSENEKWISVRVFADNTDVCFEIVDRGIGMSRKEIKNIFERFYQVDQHLSRKVGGCGLGLAIVKFIIDAHGGRIDVTSERNLGSRFVVRIPIEKEVHHEC
jgi:signal transduction histidine kinase